MLQCTYFILKIIDKSSTVVVEVASFVGNPVLEQDISVRDENIIEIELHG